MPVLASDVLDRARVPLNDVGASLYTNTVLLPVLKIVNDEVCHKLVVAGAPELKTTGASDIDVDALDTELTLPDDLIVPIQLFEKNRNASDNEYIEMNEGAWGDNRTPLQDLINWIWQTQKIKFVGATQDKTVRLRYYKMITAISTANSPVEIVLTLNLLAFRTAEMAAKNFGQNPVLAASIKVDADDYEKLVMQIININKQGTRGRRRPFRLTRRRFV
jgi:hypothetical protein